MTEEIPSWVTEAGHSRSEVHHRLIGGCRSSYIMTFTPLEWASTQRVRKVQTSQKDKSETEKPSTLSPYARSLFVTLLPPTSLSSSEACGRPPSLSFPPPDFCLLVNTKMRATR